MATTKVLFLLFCLPFTSLAEGEPGNKSSNHKLDYVNHERMLHRDLMANYNKEIRPVKQWNDTLSVSLGINLVNLHAVDENKQTVELIGWMKQSWVDQQLVWDPAEYGGITAMRIDASKLWQPDIMLFTSRAEKVGYAYEALALVYNTGYVLWIPIVKLEAGCDFDLEKFPFDEQICELKIGSWTYDTSLMDLNLMNGMSVVEMDYYSEHHEWEIKESSAEKEVKKYDCCEELYGAIIFKLKLRRYALYYGQIFLIPCLMLSLLMPVMFLLPPGTKEKTSLGVGVMLGFVLLLLLLESIVPLSSSAPVIGLYYLANVVLVCVALFFTTLITLMWTKGPKAASVPRWLKVITVDVVGRILCIKSDYVPLVDNMEPVAMTTLEANANEEHEDKSSVLRSPSRSAVIAQWRHVALVFDRLFCLIFLVIVIITAVTMASKGLGNGP